MRYELTDHERAGIRPMLPSKPRGVESLINAGDGRKWIALLAVLENIIHGANTVANSWTMSLVCSTLIWQRDR